MTKEELRKRACEYVARHQHDYAQVFTNQSCDVFRSRDLKTGETHTSVQVWVGLPDDLDELPEVDW